MTEFDAFRQFLIKKNLNLAILKQTNNLNY